MVASHRSVVLDLDGAVYLGDQPIPGAGPAIGRMAAAGLGVYFATNNSSRTRAAGAAKVARVTGFPAEPDQFFNSAMAAGQLLGDARHQVFVVGGPGIHEAVELQGSAVVGDWRDADTVIAGLDVDVTYARLRDATLAIRAGARFIATNDDATFPVPDGFWPGAGATVAFLRTSTDIAPDVAGKPHTAMRDLISSHLPDGEIWMVGDRPETDLALARNAGWTSVLVLTGVTTDPATVDPVHRPDVVLASIAELPGALGIE